MNMVTMPMLSSPIRSNVRSTTMDEKPEANPVPSFSHRMWALTNSSSLIGTKVLTMEPTLVDQNVVLTRTFFLTGRSRSFQRIALMIYVGRIIKAAAASHNGEAEPIAAPILSIPVHHIKTIVVGCRRSETLLF
jgi:hypothetical protein